MAKNDKVSELTEKEFEEFHKKGVVLIDFFAEWCMPCTMMAPVIEEVREEFGGKVKIGKVNISENEALAERYGVSSIPTFIIFKDGKIVDQFLGMTSFEDFCEKLNGFI